MILFECPYCAAHLEIDEGRAGRSMTCAFCKGQVDVPKPAKPRRREEYVVEEDDSLPAHGQLTAADIAALEQEEPPRKKKRRPKMEWQLFIGGFGFPWSPGAVLRWLLIALWAALAGGLIHAALAMGITEGLAEANIYETIVAMLAGLGAVLAGLACAGVAAIHGLTILLETTAGNDRMENWPNVTLFLDWVGDLWFIFNTAVVSVALGLGLAWLAPDLIVSRETTVAVAIFFVFPVLLLCVLETDSPFLPLSTVVLASLGRHGIAWLAFYVQVGGLLAAAAALVHHLGPQSDLRLAVPLGGMLFSAVVMIYFRLLGRLAFYCSVETEAEESPE
jgi:hypothetical protein